MAAEDFHAAEKDTRVEAPAADTIPADAAFRPLKEGGGPLEK